MPDKLIAYFREGLACPELPEVVLPFRELAIQMDELLVNGPEKKDMLVKLLEACDAAVRSRRIDLDRELFNNTTLRKEAPHGGLDRAREVAAEPE